MKKITETKTDEYYCFTKREAQFLYRLLGHMSDEVTAKLLKMSTSDLPLVEGNTLNYDIWIQLDEEFANG